jgi:hypothetical protein
MRIFLTKLIHFFFLMTDALQIIRDKLDGTGIEFTADGSLSFNYHDLEEFLEFFSNFDRDDVKPVSLTRLNS